MSERKVLNKYYPPDFDPSKIPRVKRHKTRQITVRTMVPFNMRCTTCEEYIAQGTKFNSRKETVQGEDYMGLNIYRLYIKCLRCMAEITFNSDLKNADYVFEEGAIQSHASLKLAEHQAEEDAGAEAEEEKINPMKHLENRTKASKEKMEAFQQLQLLKAINQRERFVDFDSMISDVRRESEEPRRDDKGRDRELARDILLSTSKKTAEQSKSKFGKLKLDTVGNTYPKLHLFLIGEASSSKKLNLTNRLKLAKFKSNSKPNSVSESQRQASSVTSKIEKNSRLFTSKSVIKQSSSDTKSGLQKNIRVDSQSEKNVISESSNKGEKEKKLISKLINYHSDSDSD